MHIFAAVVVVSWALIGFPALARVAAAADWPKLVPRSEAANGRLELAQIDRG